MHKIWEKLGYKPTDFKFCFSGRSDIRRIIEYDPVRNQFSVDLYKNYEAVVVKMKEMRLFQNPRGSPGDGNRNPSPAFGTSSPVFRTSP
jgi:hypothetical protein